MKRLLLMCSLSLLAGCPVYGSDDHRTDRDFTDDGCFRDADCATGSICDFDSGICFDVSQCVTDGDCPVGSYCDEPSGECVIPAVAMCGGEATCDAGFVCDFRESCRPEVDGQCLTSDTCEAGNLCVENRCVAEASTCTEDAQCPTGAACLEQLCIFLCDSGATCPSGTTCDGTRCQASAGECVDSSDCPDLRTNCVTGRCLTRCTEGCDAATETCDEEGFCRPQTLPDPEAVAPLCTTDTDCNGSVCVAGVCRASCEPAEQNANDTCEAFDGQLPICGADGYCYAESA